MNNAGYFNILAKVAQMNMPTYLFAYTTLAECIIYEVPMEDTLLYLTHF